MNSLSLMSHIGQSLLTPVQEDIRGMEDFEQQHWFWHHIMHHRLLRYLEFANDVTIITVARSLLYAYAHPGTMEGMIRLCQGLFGSQSVIIIEDEERAATLSIKVKNANTRFLFALADNQRYTLAFDSQCAMAMSDLSKIVSYDPSAFFRKFLTPGRVLKSLDISAEVTS